MLEGKQMANQYNEDSIQILESQEAVRTRPAMYIGDTGKKGLHHLVWEILDNSVDEHMAGHCSKIDVIISRFKGPGRPPGNFPGFDDAEQDDQQVDLSIEQDENKTAKVYNFRKSLG